MSVFREVPWCAGTIYHFIGVLFYNYKRQVETRRICGVLVAVNFSSWFPVWRSAGETGGRGSREGMTYSHATYKGEGGKRRNFGALNVIDQRKQDGKEGRKRQGRGGRGRKKGKGEGRKTSAKGEVFYLHAPHTHTHTHTHTPVT